LDVVPVEMGDEGQAAERNGLVDEGLAVIAQPGAEIEDDRLATLGLDHDTRRVAAIASAVRARTGSRTPYSEEGHVEHLKQRSPHSANMRPSGRAKAEQ
jgi:hypothetical protein